MTARDARAAPAVPMTITAPDVRFEIKVDGIVRTHRDVRETAIDAARFLQQRSSGVVD